ncbi:MAG: cephalosporin hydroxylase family protein [Nitrospinae bacterium]|nr:cephalosporin hydroxylase family protein [Nitrospinota bacterium]
MDDLITIDMKNGLVGVGGQSLEIGSPEAFNAISRAWLRSGWDAKYVYSFTWMGRPMIQLPEDMLRIQEAVYSVKPDVLVETGVAHGGSLVFYASLFTAMGRGRVIGVDVEIRPHNRAAMEAHEMKPLITLIEGSSVAADTVGQVKAMIKPGERVMVALDSNHTKAHVAAELEAYAPLVSVGSYIVAMDGIMGQVAGAPRSKPEWTWDNPTEAAKEFVKINPDFVIEEPPFLFNEGAVKDRVTYWPGAFIKRVR